MKTGWKKSEKARQILVTTVLIPVALVVACLAAGCATSRVQKPDGLSGPSPALRSDVSVTQLIKPVTGAGRLMVVYFSQGAGMDAALGTATPIAMPFYNPALYDARQDRSGPTGGSCRTPAPSTAFVFDLF